VSQGRHQGKHGTVNDQHSRYAWPRQSFAAYAAHELRGEIAVQLALAEATLADPNADTAALQQLGERVVAGCERQQRLLESLLTLARGEYGRLQREPVDLAATAGEILRRQDPGGLTLTIALEPAQTAGDPHLVRRLIANLVANAINHNIAGGRVDVVTGSVAGRAMVTVANTGPVIPFGEVARLFEPFQRARSGVAAGGDGVGLGLAIVQTIAAAHDATVTARARTEGGLRIDVGFPAAVPILEARICEAAF
jgi:signal transduction histidine kinase